MWVLHPPASSVDALAYYESMSQTLSSAILADLMQAFAVFFADALVVSHILLDSPFQAKKAMSSFGDLI
jgi:hypothetical protein